MDLLKFSIESLILLKIYHNITDATLYFFSFFSIYSDMTHLFLLFSLKLTH